VTNLTPSMEVFSANRFTHCWVSDRPCVMPRRLKWRRSDSHPRTLLCVCTHGRSDRYRSLAPVLLRLFTLACARPSSQQYLPPPQLRGTASILASLYRPTTRPFPRRPRLAGCAY
jgi:hypothetical protein